jgi:hypothetical protein
MFIGNEIELADQRGDRGIVAVMKLYISTPGRKTVRHFVLVNFVISHFAYCGKSLQGLVAGVGLFWGIADHPIAGAHAL